MSAIFANIDVPFALVVEYVTQAEFDAQSLSDWLSTEEQAHYEELKTHAVAKRRRQWLLGRYAAKIACRRWLKEQGWSVVAWRSIQVGNNKAGMPYLTIQGIENPPILSIAHSGDEAVAAVALPSEPIGVDIESCTPRTDLHALAKRISSKNEYQRWFGDITDDELPIRFCQLWLAKEAAAKCTGNGLQWQSEMFEIVDLNENMAEVHHAKNRYTIHYLNTGNGLAALAWQSG